MRHGLVRRRSRNISHRWMCVFRTLTCLHRTDSGPRPRHIACNIHCLFHGSLNSDTLFPCFLCKFTITFVPPLETSCREYREKHFSFSSRSTLINLILPIRNSFQGNCMVVCLQLSQLQQLTVLNLSNSLIIQSYHFLTQELELFN